MMWKVFSGFSISKIEKGKYTFYLILFYLIFNFYRVKFSNEGIIKRVKKESDSIDGGWSKQSISNNAQINTNK